MKSSEYQAFLETLPECVRDESFHWGNSRYDVAKALFLICTLGLEPVEVDVKDWAQSLGMAGPKDEEVMRVNFFNGVSDELACQPHINTMLPLIVAEHSWKEKGRLVYGALLIDGNKRLRKAFLEGKEKLMAFYLPRNIAKKVRLV